MQWLPHCDFMHCPSLRFHSVEHVAAGYVGWGAYALRHSARSAPKHRCIAAHVTQLNM